MRQIVASAVWIIIAAVGASGQADPICDHGPIASTSSGPVEGCFVHGGKVAKFLGVPYGASTANENRWRKPQPPDTWGPEARSARSWGPGCIQAGFTKGDPDVPTYQSEDCLLLNIFTPSLPPKGDGGLSSSSAAAAAAAAPLPVMVFFHGGSFVEGSNFGPWYLYDGSIVADTGNVVVVTANYRLDVMGWLVTSSGSATGNYGLMDQQEALRWVNRNVRSFGGDPSRVTVWGESAGGMSTLVHMSSPPSRGLFSKVIMESNPAGYRYLTKDYLAKFGDSVAAKVGCKASAKSWWSFWRKQSQLECLQQASPELLMNASRAVEGDWYDIIKESGWRILEAAVQWGPVLDPSLLPLQPMDAVAAGAIFNPADILTGHNTDEMAMFVDNSPYGKEYPYTAYESVLLGAEKIKNRYWQQYNITPGLDGLDMIMTDYWFKCAKEAIAASLVSSAGKRAFVYRFSHNLSIAASLWETEFGLPQCVRKVCHMAELPFVFGNNGSLGGKDWSFTDEEIAYSDAMVRAWTNFAHTGDPNIAPRLRGAVRQGAGSQGLAEHLLGLQQAGGKAQAARRLLGLRGGTAAAGAAGGVAGELSVEDEAPPSSFPWDEWPDFDPSDRRTLVLSDSPFVESNGGQDGICTFWDGIGYTY